MTRRRRWGLSPWGWLPSGVQQSFHVPLWVIACSAGAISLGTTFGGWRLIRTLGGRIYRIRPVNAFTAQFASAAVILSSAAFGSPVSTTHVISSAIMGSGAAERVNKVRWNIAKGMLVTWALTIPLSAAFSALVYTLIQAASHVHVTIAMLPVIAIDCCDAGIKINNHEIHEIHEKDDLYSRLTLRRQVLFCITPNYSL